MEIQILNRMRNCLIYCLIVVLIPSCTIQNISKKALNNSLGSLIITQKVMTQFLVESTNAIYQNEKLQPDSSVYIYLLTASFLSNVDTFELEIDSIKAILIDDTTMLFNKINIVNDSVLFEKVSIPYYNSYYGSDTIKVNVICKYLPNMNFKAKEEKLRCLTAEYLIIEKNIFITDKFNACSFNP